MMHSIPPSERPRERCLNSGPHALSLRECLALILGSGPAPLGCMGVAGQLVSRSAPAGLSAEDETVAFFRAMESTAEFGGTAYLQEVPGLGPSGSARILAAFELARRYSAYRSGRSRPAPARRASLPDEALATIPPEFRSQAREWLGITPLYRTGNLGRFCLIERGTRTHVNVDPVELFASLLALRPRAFFLFHNHPSGDTKPSHADQELTRKVGDVAAELGIPLLGHAIVGPEGETWINPIRPC